MQPSLRQTLIHVARATRDELVARRRARSPRTACGRRRPSGHDSATSVASIAGRRSMRAAIRPSTYGAVGRLAVDVHRRSCSGSRARPTRVRRGTSPSAPARSAREPHGRGEQRPGSDPPGSTRKPSPGARSGPHTKHVGNGCQSGCTTTGDAAAASCRGRGPTAPAGTSTSSVAAHRLRRRRRRRRAARAAPALASTVQSASSSGDGRRSVTLGRAVDVRGEQSRGDAAVPAVGWSAEPAIANDRRRIGHDENPGICSVRGTDRSGEPR